MFLKSLEIQGFKSFPDKTVLQFGSDITAIVGPNGSGKSNISDAISWVMGEQSSKALRGAKMEDVIFGGTQKRSAVGFAEATLVLDNQDGSLKLETPEVMITRRYYRSGESEYYINKQSARLRDIHELLMDTGLGREGYSNIGQGRIDEILAVKSTDRREIFEEAAGISKCRYRREETERRLAATEDNLLRIGDKISELEMQVEPLRQQAEKAQKYLVLRDELKGYEITVWLDSLAKIEANAKKQSRTMPRRRSFWSRRTMSSAHFMPPRSSFRSNSTARALCSRKSVMPLLPPNRSASRCRRDRLLCRHRSTTPQKISPACGRSWPIRKTGAAASPARSRSSRRALRRSAASLRRSMKSSALQRKKQGAD